MPSVHNLRRAAVLTVGGPILSDSIHADFHMLKVSAASARRWGEGPNE